MLAFLVPFVVMNRTCLDGIRPGGERKTRKIAIVAYQSATDVREEKLGRRRSVVCKELSNSTPQRDDRGVAEVCDSAAATEVSGVDACDVPKIHEHVVGVAHRIIPGGHKKRMVVPFSRSH